MFVVGGGGVAGVWVEGGGGGGGGGIVVAKGDTAEISPHLPTQCVITYANTNECK